MQKGKYYITLKLKIDSDEVDKIVDKEIVDERFKKEFSCIFNNDDIEVKEFKTKLKIKDIK